MFCHSFVFIFTISLVFFIYFHKPFLCNKIIAINFYSDNDEFVEMHQYFYMTNCLIILLKNIIEFIKYGFVIVSLIKAEKYGTVNLVTPKPDKYLGVPSKDEWKFSDDADYVYYCSNETIGGELSFYCRENVCSHITNRKIKNL